MSTCYPYCECNGDSAITIVFGDKINVDVLKQVIVFSEIVKAENISGIVDIVPAYASVTLLIDISVNSVEQVEHKVSALHQYGKGAVIPDYPLVDIPVCYDPALGLDIIDVAEYCGLSIDELIAAHTAPTYQVYMLGFMPGFLYLGGMDSRIAMPRKATPRTHIPQGAVGIAGQQTGVYPFVSPGGWQIIACTPLLMFDSGRLYPAIAKPLQSVKFRAIELSEYNDLLDAGNAKQG